MTDMELALLDILRGHDVPVEGVADLSRLLRLGGFPVRQVGKRSVFTLTLPDVAIEVAADYDAGENWWTVSNWWLVELEVTP